MSFFGIFSLLLLVLTTIFALSNPSPVAIRFLAWEFQTTLALALIGGLVIGGFLVFISGMAGQRHLRARLREVQARLRDAESRLESTRGGVPGPPVIDPRPPVIDPRPPVIDPRPPGSRPGERP